MVDVTEVLVHWYAGRWYDPAATRWRRVWALVMVLVQDPGRVPEGVVDKLDVVGVTVEDGQPAQCRVERSYRRVQRAQQLGAVRQPGQRVRPAGTGSR